MQTQTKFSTNPDVNGDRRPSKKNFIIQTLNQSYLSNYLGPDNSNNQMQLKLITQRTILSTTHWWLTFDKICLSVAMMHILILSSISNAFTLSQECH